MVENATMIPEGVLLEACKVRFLVRQCINLLAVAAIAVVCGRTYRAVAPVHAIPGTPIALLWY
jgi:hypothetical protein